jgi:hypothetical protein
MLVPALPACPHLESGTAENRRQSRHRPTWVSGKFGLAHPGYSNITTWRAHMEIEREVCRENERAGRERDIPRENERAIERASFGI